MLMNQEIKERIFAAADELHAANPNGEFPNVEAVRQLSRAGMNNVVEAMKEWRAKQRKQVQAVREPLPTKLHGILQATGQSLWETAQQLANESLEAARAAFEAEKTDLTELSVQQSAAFEAQTGELEVAQDRIVKLEAQATATIEQQQKQANELAELRTQYEESQRRATLAEQKAQETEHRATELRAELDRAHQDADRLRQERDKARDAAATAREEAAKLRGELEAIKTQNAVLLAALKPAGHLKRTQKA
ncbi:hypothetical protein FHG75_02120 [Xylella fastidiosa subsp. multiplex]|nr:hypothetical protein [Xylella fastidiosa subsp. multiplex]